jgi:cyclopropane fatty-acyl-phospholipid synthase-like methyltransferase
MTNTPVPARLSWAVEQVDAPPMDHILEIGCGSGHAVALLHARLPGAIITAIDRSALQVDRARARNAAAIAGGRVRIEQVELADAPALLGTGRFRRVLAINVNAFWTDPAASLPAPAMENHG